MEAVTTTSQRVRALALEDADGSRYVSWARELPRLTLERGHPSPHLPFTAAIAARATQNRAVPMRLRRVYAWARPAPERHEARHVDSIPWSVRCESRVSPAKSAGRTASAGRTVKPPNSTGVGEAGPP